MVGFLLVCSNVSVFGWAFFGEYFVPYFVIIRDWSLITGRGGATKQEGGACEVLPLRKGGGGKSLSHAEGGAQTVLRQF